MTNCSLLMWLAYYFFHRRERARISFCVLAAAVISPYSHSVEPHQNTFLIFRTYFLQFMIPSPRMRALIFYHFSCWPLWAWVLICIIANLKMKLEWWFCSSWKMLGLFVQLNLRLEWTWDFKFNIANKSSYRERFLWIHEVRLLNKASRSRPLTLRRVSVQESSIASDKENDKTQCSQDNSFEFIINFFDSIAQI